MSNPADADTAFKVFSGIAAVIAALISVYMAYRLKKLDWRLAQEKERQQMRGNFYLPLLRFTNDVDRRLGHILDKLPDKWLNGEYLDSVKAGRGFASNQNEVGYFITSSIYMIACFFGWAEALKTNLDSRSIRPKWYRWLSNSYHKRNYFTYDQEISTISKLFQYEEFFEDYVRQRNLSTPRDACRFHKLIQYSVGELMLIYDEKRGFRCKSFREFLALYTTEPEFQKWFLKIEELFRDLSDFPDGLALEEQVAAKNDVRPLRLLAIRYWCRRLMNKVAYDIGIPPIDPDAALVGVSVELQDLIKSINVEELELYLFGLSPKQPAQ